MVVAALAADVEFEAVYVDGQHVTKYSELLDSAEVQGVRVHVLGDGVLEKISDTQTPQPIIAAIRFVRRDIATEGKDGTVIVLHDVRDPGNVGTIIRTADASGASAVVLTGDCVDPYNPKTLRATAGSIFHVPVVLCDDLAEAMHILDPDGKHSYATVVHDGQSLDDVSFGSRAVFVMGNEATGLTSDDAALAGNKLTIPMSGRAESLNVAVAAALVLFAGQRDRLHSSRTTAP